jgi:hypothetical protein
MLKPVLRYMFSEISCLFADMSYRATILMMLLEDITSKIEHLFLPIPGNSKKSILRMAMMHQWRLMSKVNSVPRPLRVTRRKQLERGAIHGNLSPKRHMIRKSEVSTLHNGVMSWIKHKDCGVVGWCLSVVSQKERPRRIWTWP